VEKKVGNVLIKVVKGDITEEDVEAVVNAANSFLRHGGGVAGAIVRKGGKVIQQESDKIVKERGRVPVGEAVWTSAGNLKAKYVIHTVGPVWGEGEEEEKLRKAVKSALSLAERLRVSSVALPAISTGIFGYPKREGVRVIVNEVLNFVKSSPNFVREIRLVSIDDETVELFKSYL